MKKIILSLVLILTVSFAFASNGEKKAISLKYDNDRISIKVIDSKLYGEEYVVEEIRIINQDLTCTILHVVKRKDGSTMGEFTIEAPDNHPDCGGVVFHLLYF